MLLQNIMNANRKPPIPTLPRMSCLAADQLLIIIATTKQIRKHPHPHMKNTNVSTPSTNCMPHPVGMPLAKHSVSFRFNFFGILVYKSGRTLACVEFSKKWTSMFGPIGGSSRAGIGSYWYSSLNVSGGIAGVTCMSASSVRCTSNKRAELVHQHSVRRCGDDLPARSGCLSLFEATTERALDGYCGIASVAARRNPDQSISCKSPVGKA